MFAGSFAQRALLYADYDGELYGRTRFFGAAAMTNRVLSYLGPRTLVSPLSSQSHRALWVLGCRLEAVNRVSARLVARGRFGLSRIDERMVWIEQSEVEVALGSMQAASPEFHARFINEVDQVLNLAPPSRIILKLWPAIAWYLAVIRGTRAELGSAVSFANQWHRIQIGLHLVDHLRRSKPPLVSGGLLPHVVKCR
jgi:hypothetical protein